MFDGWDLVSETAPRTPGFQVLRIAGRRFAVDSQRVVAAVESAAPTQVPGTPSWVRGVILWEGQVVPVVATAQRLGLELLADAAAISLLQVEVAGEPFFIEIESLGEVVNTLDIELSDEPLVLGFIELDGDPVPVLDLDAVTDVGGGEVGR